MDTIWTQDRLASRKDAHISTISLLSFIVLPKQNIEFPNNNNILYQ